MPAHLDGVKRDEVGSGIYHRQPTAGLAKLQLLPGLCRVARQVVGAIEDFEFRFNIHLQLIHLALTRRGDTFDVQPEDRFTVAGQRGANKVNPQNVILLRIETEQGRRYNEGHPGLIVFRVIFHPRLHQIGRMGIGIGD